MRTIRFWPACGLGVAAAALCAQTFRERVEVDLVRVELLALDSKGQPVRGLKPSDFTVLVDGRPIKLENFEEARGALSPQPPSPEATPPATSPTETGAPAPTPSPAAASGRHFLAVLVDETSSEQSNRQATLREVFQFLERPLPSGVEALVMRFDGNLHIECPWTSDTGRLRRAAAAIAQHQYAARLSQPGQARDPGLGTTLLQLDAMEAVGHVRTSLAGLFDALHVFPEKPGRKSIYFVSDGVPFLAPIDVVKDLIATAATNNDSPLATPRARNEANYDQDLLFEGLAWSRMRSASLLTDITRLALVRGIEINPVRSTAHDYGANVTSSRHGQSKSLDRNSLRGGAGAPMTDLAVGGSMTAVAETTGGEAVLSRRDLESDLQREVARGNTAYALSFRDPFPGDHLFHHISISPAKSGLTLRYRRGYRILDVRESLIQATVNHLYVPTEQNDLGVRLDIQSLGMTDGRATAQITIAYPAPPEAGGKPTAGGAVQILGTCAVRDGKLSDPIDMSGQTQPTSVDEKTWLTRTGRVSLLPGSYRFSFAIRDEQTGITSYLTFDRRLP